MSSVIRSVFVLAISIVLVHLVYVEYIWPQAETDLALAKEQGQSTVRTVAVVLKDLEQEVCLILMLWGFYLILEKSFLVIRYRYLFEVDLLHPTDAEDPDTDSNVSEQMASGLDALQRLPATIQHTPLVQTLTTSVRRFVITRNVQNTSDAIVTGVEALANRLESENSMIRYLIWAIPSIGFIGTVRGIGEALVHADEALSGDIVNMAASLGVAFNSTFVALIISIFLMFFLHQLQRLQDGLVVDTQAYCERFLLNRIGKTDEGR